MSNKKIIFSGFMAALLIGAGANAAEIASKGYVDNREAAVKTWVGTQDYATSTELSTGLATKADADATYTKSEVDDAIAGIDTTIPDGSVTKAKLDTAVQTSLGKADTAMQSIAAGSVAKTQLATDVQTSLGKADTAVQAAGLVPYAKTADLGALASKDTVVTADITDKNVTKAKLADDVQTSLGKADTALQAAAIADLATKTELAAKANTADLGALATKDTIVTADITDANVTKAKLAADVQTSLGKADTAMQAIADGSVTEAKLSTSVNASLDLADSSVQSADLAPYAKTAAVLPKPSAECLTATANCVLSINKTTKEIYWANVVE